MKEHENLVFPLEEYQRRLDELRQRMVDRNLDVVIVNEPENLNYLTGYQTTGYSYFQALIVPLEKEPLMVTRLLEESNVIARTWVEITRPYSDTGDAIETTWFALKEFGLTNDVNIGYEKNCYFFPYYQQERLLATVLDANFFDCSGIIEEGRIVKSSYEIEAMRKAAVATEAGMQAGIDFVKEGVTENQIAAEVHYAMFNAGGEYPSVSPYITSGPRCMIGHATWEGRQVGRDECVFLEIGGCFRRYHTAMMRTIYIGEPPQVVLDAEKLVLEAIETGLENMKEGVTVSAIDQAMRSVIARSQSGQIITRSGYSIGLAFAPSWDEGHIISLKPGENTYLQENMTFHMIPWMVGVGGKHVMALSETVRVGKEKGESFFNFERKLFSKE